MDLKKLLPLEINFEIKNMLNYLKKNNIKKWSKNKKIILIDAASYNNLGDQAISEAISKFIVDNAKDYEYVEILESEFCQNYIFLKKNIKETDIICLNGGGNMGNLYPRYEAIRRKVIKTFNNNKIIIFPQTIDYGLDGYGKKSLNNSIKIYNSNKNLIICAREKKSFEIMKKIYNNVILVPDIVFYLINDVEKTNEKKGNVFGICLRSDKESILSNTERNKIIGELKKEGYKIVEFSTMSDIQKINRITRKKILKEKFEQFKNCDFIITDRLHGMIFSIICGVTCIAFDNSNKKVSGVYNIVKNNFFNVLFLDKWNIKKVNSFIKKEKKENIFNKELAYKKIVEELK